MLRSSLLTLLLGAGRGTAPRTDATRIRTSASSFEAPTSAVNPLQFGRAYQLPPFGHGNGVEALFWTPLARVAAARVDRVLAAMAEEDIAAWAAPCRTAGPVADRPHDLSVAEARLADAAEVLRLLDAA